MRGKNAMIVDPAPDGLESLLAAGLSSKELSEEEFWGSVDDRTNKMLSENKAGQSLEP